MDHGIAQSFDTTFLPEHVFLVILWIARSIFLILSLNHQHSESLNAAQRAASPEDARRAIVTAFDL